MFVCGAFVALCVCVCVCVCLRACVRACVYSAQEVEKEIEKKETKRAWLVEHFYIFLTALLNHSIDCGGKVLPQ